MALKRVHNKDKSKITLKLVCNFPNMAHTP